MFADATRTFLAERVTAMVCCSCFGLPSKTSRGLRPNPNTNMPFSQELLLDENGDDDGDVEEEEVEEEDDNFSYDGVAISTVNEDNEWQCNAKRSEEIIRSRIQIGLICREVPVKETVKVFRSEDENGNKMINEYIREYKIGSGSYGKVVLYLNSIDGRHYAIKAFHKSHLIKQRVGPSETAMTDVLRERS